MAAILGDGDGTPRQDGRPRMLVVAVVLLMVGLVGCSGGGSSADSAVPCEPGDDLVAFDQIGTNGYEGSAMVAVTGAGSRKVRNLTGDWVATDPSISPDGRNVVVVRADGDYESAGPGATTLWLVGVHGEHPRPLTEGPRDSSPSWSPDGRTIAFVHQDSAQRVSILSIPSNGGRTRRIVAPQDAGISSLAWAPAGDRLAYVTNNYDGSAETASVSTVRADGGHPQKAAALAGVSSSQLSWDPGGNAVWLAGTGNERGGLWKVGLADGNVRRMDRQTFWADWSSDGQRLYVIRRQKRDGDFMLSVVRVVDGRLRIERDLGPAGGGFPYGYYGFDVGPCLPDGLRAGTTDPGADQPLEGTRWREGASVLRFEPVDKACKVTSCPQQIFAAASHEARPATIAAFIGPKTITTTSSDADTTVVRDCFGAAGYFSTDSPTRYRIDGDQLHLSRDGCDDLLLVADGIS